MTDGIDKDWFALNPAKYTEKELIAVIEILHSFNVPEYEADNRDSGLTEAHSHIREKTGLVEELLAEKNPRVKGVRDLVAEVFDELQSQYWKFDRLMVIPVSDNTHFRVHAQVSHDCRDLQEGIEKRFASVYGYDVTKEKDDAGFVNFQCVVKLKEDDQ